MKSQLKKYISVLAITNPVIKGPYGNNAAAAKDGSLFLTIVSAVLSFIMIIAALLVLLNLVEGGIAWISSAGDSGKLQKARDRMLHAVIGIIILAASLAIWRVVRDFLGISLDFSVLFP